MSHHPSHTPPPLSSHIIVTDPQASGSLHQNYASLPLQHDGYQPVVHQSPNFNNVPHLTGSPQIDAQSYHAPSPSLSIASIHSVHSIHSVQSPHSPHSFHGHQSPTQLAPTFIDAQIPTYHGRQGTFAGFVNSGPLTSPRAAFANFSLQSPTSPFVPGQPTHGHSHLSFSPGHALPHKRLSVSSVASSNHLREGSIDQGVNGYVTPNGIYEQMGMSMMDKGMTVGVSNAYSHDQEPGAMQNSRKSEANPPAWIDLKTKAGKDRKRLPLACIACRRKKIRCSGQKPACKHCLRSRIPCVYKTNTRKATPRTDYMAMLDKRLKRMEERVIKLVPKDSEAASIPRAILKPRAEANTKSSKKSKKRVADEAFGPVKNFDTWFKQDETTDTDSASIKVEQEPDKSLFSDGEDSLPSRDIQLHLAEVYFEYVYAQSYPLLHKPTFMRNLLNCKVPPILVLAICAVSARFSTHPKLRGSPAFMRGEEWAAPARDISLRHYDVPSITVLIVYILLGLHEFGTCHGGRSWMFAGMAQRMAYSLQLHQDRKDSDSIKATERPKDVDSTDAELRRRVMWSCFLMDRFISSGSDRPMCIQENSISIALPVPEFDFITGVHTSETMVAGKSQKSIKMGKRVDVPRGTTAHLIRLVSIWGQMITYFNLGQMKAEKVVMWKSTSQFMRLANTLHEFKFSPDLLWNEDNLAIHRAAKIDNLFVFMHIVYQHLRLFCHRFALPGWGILISKEMPPSFLQESASIALDAANEVSSLVKEAMQSNVTAPFAGYATFYACNLLALVVQRLLPSARSAQVVQLAEDNLQSNMQFLFRMTNWWGMFHFMMPELKKLVQVTKDSSAIHNSAAGQPSEQEHNVEADKGAKRGSTSIFQYGDWFNKYGTRTKTMNLNHGETSSSGEQNDDHGILGANHKGLVGVEEYFDKTPSGDLHPRISGDNGPAPKRTKSQKARPLTSDIRDSPCNRESNWTSSSSFQTSPSGMALDDGRYSTVPSYVSAPSTQSHQFYSPIQTANHTDPSINTGYFTNFTTWPQPDGFSPPMVNDSHVSLGGYGGLAAVPGMNAGWYMPWNMQPLSSGTPNTSFPGVTGFNMPYAALNAGSGEPEGMHGWANLPPEMNGDMRQGPNDDKYT